MSLAFLANNNSFNALVFYSFKINKIVRKTLLFNSCDNTNESDKVQELVSCIYKLFTWTALCVTRNGFYRISKVLLDTGSTAVQWFRVIAGSRPGRGSTTTC